METSPSNRSKRGRKEVEVVAEMATLDYEARFREIVLPRLVSTYEAGRLVPFIGVGMSAGTCTLWWEFIARLEQRYKSGEAKPIDKDTAPAELIRRANKAVRALKANADGVFESVVREALAKGTAVPTQTRALAKLPWPLVLSTNWDNCYVTAFHEHDRSRPFGVVGRSPEDCQRVLNSLSTAGRSLLWALQGHLDAPCKMDGKPSPWTLVKELVVGHDEYRRVTYREPHFRRAFAEVFRHRALLFLGSGIRESYLQELFGEVLETYGPCARPHYAFIEAGQVDPEFMLARFQIVVVEYPEGRHAFVESALNELSAAVHSSNRTFVPVAWSFGRINGRDKNPNGWTSVPQLEVVRGPLPESRVDNECLAVSAGGDAQFFFTTGIRALMGKWGVALDEQPTPTPSTYVGEYTGRHVYAVRARAAHDQRNLSVVFDAARESFERLAPHYACIRMQLLASGGVDKREGTLQDWKLRPFPVRFSFIQIVRAWSAWLGSHPGVRCKLALHVVDAPVYAEIASGRIDVLELLSCSDIRFGTEVLSENGEIERRVFQTEPTRTLEAIVRDLNVVSKFWTVEVSPAPTLDDLERPIHALDSCLELTLQQLGVVPGSTLHFRRGPQRRNSSRKSSKTRGGKKG